MSNYALKIALDEDRCIDAFSASTMVLSKPRWTSDNSAAYCASCGCGFTQLRRRHHCRQCGLIFCSACCNCKADLPHLGYDQPERLCNACLPMAELIANATSTYLNDSYPAVEALTKMICDDGTTLKSFVDIGGLHAIIFAARTKNTPLRSQVVKAFDRLLSADLNLTPVLVALGATHVLFTILDESDSSQELVVSSLHLVGVLCATDPKLFPSISDGVLDSVLPLCGSTNASIALPALQCLCRISQNASSHSAIVDCSKRNTVTRLMGLLSTRDEIIQEVLLQILANLSSGDEASRDRIIQEDIFNGNYLSKVLYSRPVNQQVLCNAARLVANLAASRTMQGGFHEELLALCQLILEFPNSEPMMVHASRGVANFAQFQQNASFIIPYLRQLVGSLLMSTNYEIRYQVLRVCIALLKHTPDSCLRMLNGNGAVAILDVFSQDIDILRSLEEQVKSRVQCIDSLKPPS